MNFANKRAMLAFLVQKYPYHIYFDYIDEIRDNLNEIFGDDGFVPGNDARDFYYETDSRWTYMNGKLYFKSESDLIEFKLRFL